MLKRVERVNVEEGGKKADVTVWSKRVSESGEISA